MSNAVRKRIVYAVSVELKSPLCISQGDGVLTDDDILLNGEGVPFVPGASLAGAMRGYIEKGKQKECIFGYEDMGRDKGRMSSLFVSDLFFDGKVNTAVRDGVSLSNNKTALSQGKFDMEVIDTGARGSFCLELVIREKDDEASFQSQLEQVFFGWREREIRLGRKKSRGFGEISLQSIVKKEFDAHNYLEYKDAYCPIEEKDNTWTIVDLSKLSAQEEKYVTITLPLKLEGGISIRQYSVKKGEPDFVHITANGQPVIPGTSFTGAIRHRLTDILTQLGVVNRAEIIDSTFGYVRPKSGDAHISHVVVGECVLAGSKRLEMVRNGISRFESGSRSGALFKELSYIGGTTQLEIKVKKTGDEDAMVGLLLLALMDVQNGFLAVGGQTAIGRGLFSANGELTVHSDKSREEYLKKAFEALRRE